MYHRFLSLFVSVTFTFVSLSPNILVAQNADADCQASLQATEDMAQEISAMQVVVNAMAAQITTMVATMNAASQKINDATGQITTFTNTLNNQVGQAQATLKGAISTFEGYAQQALGAVTWALSYLGVSAVGVVVAVGLTISIHVWMKRATNRLNAMPLAGQDML